MFSWRAASVCSMLLYLSPGNLCIHTRPTKHVWLNATLSCRLSVTLPYLWPVFSLQVLKSVQSRGVKELWHPGMLFHIKIKSSVWSLYREALNSWTLAVWLWSMSVLSLWPVILSLLRKTPSGVWNACWKEADSFTVICCFSVEKCHFLTGSAMQWYLSFPFVASIFLLICYLWQLPEAEVVIQACINSFWCLFFLLLSLTNNMLILCKLSVLLHHPVARGSQWAALCVNKHFFLCVRIFKFVICQFIFQLGLF